MSSRYGDVYAAWQADPEGFWTAAAGAIDWSRKWDKLFDGGAGVVQRVGVRNGLAVVHWDYFSVCKCQHPNGCIVRWCAGVKGGSLHIAMPK